MIERKVTRGVTRGAGGKLAPDAWVLGLPKWKFGSCVGSCWSNVLQSLEIVVRKILILEVRVASLHISEVITLNILFVEVKC